MAWIIDIVLGRRCAGCGESGAPLCGTCHASVRATLPAPGAAFTDGGVIGVLIRRAKSGHWRGGGSMLAALVVERWASGVGEAPPEVDLVTWVPADRTRARHRGVHVPEQVARRLAHHLGVPAVPLLQRPGPSVAQRGLGREARRVNVQGAFRIAGGFRPAVASHGKRVLLVDDVRTTGATLDAASDVLGPWCASVQGFAVAGVQNYARSAENVLTKTRPDADDLGHEPRKAAGPLTTPRPP